MCRRSIFVRFDCYEAHAAVDVVVVVRAHAYCLAILRVSGPSRGYCLAILRVSGPSRGCPNREVEIPAAKGEVNEVAVFH